MHFRKKHHSGIILLLSYSIIHGRKRLYNIKDKQAQSLLRNFANYILEAWNKKNSFKDTAGNAHYWFNYVETDEHAKFFADAANMRIYFSNNVADQSLSFDDYKLNYTLGNMTRITGYPSLSINEGDTFSELVFEDSYLYSGSNTSIYACAWYNTVRDTDGTIRWVMIAKDVFDPALDCPENSRLTFTYKIRMEV